MDHTNSLNVWMTEKEKALLLSHLNQDDSYLEWGSGGSTIEAAKIVKVLVSIEHDSEWYKKVSDELKLNRKPGLDYDYRLVLSDKPRSFPNVKREEFESYITEVHKINRTYDKVLIDGRARTWCAEEVRQYLNQNAIVFIHDWDRPHYWDVLKWYKIVGLTERLVMLRIK